VTPFIGNIMFYNIKYIFIAVYLFLVISCSTNTMEGELPVINIDADNWHYIPISLFSDDIEYIPLETASGSLIDRIDGIEFSGDLVLVDANTDCFLYDITGRLISKIGVEGRGPGEYRFITNLRFGKDNDIYIQDLTDMVIYSVDGDFKERKENILIDETYSVGGWHFINDTLLIAKVNSFLGNEEIKAAVIDINSGDIIRDYANNNKVNKERASANLLEMNSNIFMFDDELYFKELSDDTLFVMDKELNMLPVMVFDCGKYKYPNESRSEAGLFFDEFFKCISVNNLMFTRDYIFIDCYFGKNFPAKRLTPAATLRSMASSPDYNTTRGIGVYDRRSGEIRFSEPTSTDNFLYTSGLYNDIDGGPRFFPNTVVNDSTMVMWAEATDLKYHIASDDFKNAVVKYPEKKQKLLELADSLEETDNPVLMVIKVKSNK
jgi:hypothetical protein